METAYAPASKLPQIGIVTLAELCASLSAGWSDFRRAPQFGVFFASVYVFGGFVLYLGFTATDQVWWTMPFTVAFPLIGPFAAVGLYEVSRRIEAELPLSWSEILGVVFAERKRQIPWMGAVMVVWMLFWLFLSHVIFALGLGIGAMRDISSSMEALLSAQGLTVLVVELLVGAAFAAVLFAAAVVSLPLMLECEVDFVSAMLLSFRTVAQNRAVMGIWAAMIAGIVFLGMLPFLLGLFVVLPVLGHATWHVYRRALYDPVQ